MQNARLDKAQAEIKIAGRNINNLRNVDDTTLMAKSKEKLRGLLMKVKKRRLKYPDENSALKKTKIMASGPITPWQIDGETMKVLIFLGFKTTTNGDYSHEIKRLLLLGRKL